MKQIILVLSAVSAAAMLALVLYYVNEYRKGK